MRLSPYHVVDRAVPAVDRAVVEAQFAQPRDVPSLERLPRVFGVAQRQQRPEVARVLLEQVEDRRDPALAEPHARAHPLRLQLFGTRVGGLLEQPYACLAPQLLAVEEGRVRAHRDLDAGNRLAGVPVRGKPLGLYLLVELDAGAGSL